MNRSARAFTLVELLIVISIVALLIAILLPALDKSRRSAKKMVCGNNLRQLAIGYATYATDYKDWLPANDITSGGVLNSTFSMYYLKSAVRDKMLSDYGLHRPIWDCPTSTSPILSYYWDNPIVASTFSLIVTPFSVWAGRTAGNWGEYSPNGALPTDCPQKMSDQIRFKGGQTVMPWFNDHVMYAGAPYDSYQSIFTYVPSEAAGLMHYGEGMNSAQPDGSVFFKPFTGLESDPTGDPKIMKFMGPVNTGSFPGYWAY